LAKQPLRFDPGTGWEYSYGMDVLGRVIEVASGMPLDKFLKQRVFMPLGMTDTAFYISAKRARKQLSALYLVRRKGKSGKRFQRVRVDGKRPEASGWVQGRNAKILSGGGFVGSCDGGLVSSLRDQVLFSNTIANMGFAHASQRQVLQPATVRLGCRDWLSLKSTTKSKNLKGWHTAATRQSCMGWAPFGITEGNKYIYMGGIGFWQVDRLSKTVLVTFPNASEWSNFKTVPGWKPEIDELDSSLQLAQKNGEAEKLNKKRKSESTCDCKKSRKKE